MKRTLLLLATFLLAGSGSIQAQERGIGPGRSEASQPVLWNRYTVKGEEFSVNLPTVPAMTTIKVLRNGDQKRQLQRHLKTSLDGVVFTIDVFENPKPRQSLEDFIAEQKANTEFDPATERSLMIYGVPGKGYLSANKSSPGIVQFFATEKRLYRFAASGPDVEGRAGREFFLSIKVGKEDGIEVSDGPGYSLEEDTGERVYRGKEVDVKAKLLTKPEPSYPGKALESRASGLVILRVIFAKTGRVESIRVVQGQPDGLTEKAIEAAKRITFIPAMKDGKPVSMWMQLEYNFYF